MANYSVLLVATLVVISIPVLTFCIITPLIRASRPGKVKLEPYECGVPTAGEPRQRYSVRYYVIAVLFVVFDVETVFLFPWAVKYKALGLFGFVEMVVFLAILVVGYLYAWRKGALEWV